MKNTVELDTKILNKNLEITKLTKQLDDLTSENVDLTVKICDRDVQLQHLLIEVHDKMYSMMEYCERLQPVVYDSLEEDHMDLTEEDGETFHRTNLFKLKNEMVDEDQTSRSILKDVRKVIKSLE